ncbi:hypothetical protein MSAN_00589900 [Mycena sanguinolenta]|uniref:Uncharacterized protein n=1 Tax=Mycena sanguinolenta TaxID=230812 RepID=A0A8H7DHW3_9AGAR|nr:hypothetical protein MSAN_00589900 [Mycena sanguinolenta]
MPTFLVANATELLNPTTPLAFLPPALADQFEQMRYLFAATLGAYIWDIGMNLGKDYALLFMYRVRFPTIVYFLSRAFTLAYILACFVYAVAPVQNCTALALGYSICCVLSQTATAMLFFLRVTAVWHPSKVAFAVFSLLWISVLGAGITIPLGIRGAHIGPTAQCIMTAVTADTQVAVIMPLINDTAIFLAITYRILAHMVVADSIGARIRVFLGSTGPGLSTLSQALLQSGQHFYFVAVATHITLLVLLKLPRLLPIDHGMFAIPALALINAMACLVFRRIIFGRISSDGISKTPITLTSHFHAMANPGSLSLHSPRNGPTTTGCRLNTTYELDVRVQNEIDKFEDGADANQQDPSHKFNDAPRSLGLSQSSTPYIPVATAPPTHRHYNTDTPIPRGSSYEEPATAAALTTVSPFYLILVTLCSRILRDDNARHPTQLNCSTPPSTPLAFLPPALADQFERSRYLFAATLGVRAAYVWDIGFNLGNGYALLFKHRVGFPTIVYFLSR